MVFVATLTGVFGGKGKLPEMVPVRAGVLGGKFGAPLAISVLSLAVRASPISLVIL